ncbi:MAG: type IV secretion system DNA-binding domain-containing protein [bacterium]
MSLDLSFLSITIPNLRQLAVIVVAVIIFILLIWLIISLLRRKAKQMAVTRQSVSLVVLQVTVPKIPSGEQGEGKDSPKNTQDQIAAAEGLFALLGGLKAERGFKSWWQGRTDHFSLEIVNWGGLIRFYLAVPEKTRLYVEEQIHAQYPSAQIEQVDDYNLFTPTGSAVGGYLTLKRDQVFSVKTYRKLDHDPLEVVTSALSRLQEGETAAVQIIIRSAKKEWHWKGKKLASVMQQGKNYEQASKEVTSGSFLDALGFLFKKLPDQKPAEYRLSPLEQEMVKNVEEKTAKAGLDVNIRLVAVGKDEASAKRILANLQDAFAQYSIYEYGNSFKINEPSTYDRLLKNFIYRQYESSQGFVLNAEEVASLFHFPLPSNDTPNIVWLLAKTASAPSNVPTDGLYLGYNQFRGKKTNIYIKEEDRLRHLYIIGGSGTGKSVFQQNMAALDAKAGRGFCIIDPHGELAEDVLAKVPKERAEDVVYFNPGDVERPMGLNLLEYDSRYPEQKTFVINEMLKIFDKLYDLKTTGGPIFEQYMRNALLLIMEDPTTGSTLMEIPKVLSDPDFRAMKLQKCSNPVVHDFWVKEAEKAGGEAALANMVPYITSKLTQFVANDIMRPIIGQQNSSFNIREIMDQGKILIVNLSKGRLGDLNAYLLGMVIVGKILMAALSRTDVPRESRKNFYLYIDEFQNFITDSIAIILSEARKYGLGLIIAHQYIGQLAPKGDATIKEAVFGNVGTKAVFRVGVEDAKELVKEFAPVFNEYDMINTPGLTANIRLLVNNTATTPFTLKIDFPDKGSRETAEAIKQLSRLKYGQDRLVVEEEIRARSAVQSSGE